MKPKPRLNLDRPSPWKGAMVLGLFLVLGFAAAIQAQTYEATGTVNLRQGASDNAAVTRVLEAGEKVDKISESGKYFQVKAQKDGQTGYVWADNLKLSTDAAKTPVPGFDALKAEISRSAGPKAGGPGRYFFESVLEFVRGENHPLYVILLPLLVAAALAAGGILLLKALLSRMDQVVPDGLTPARSRAIKVSLFVACSYLLTVAAAYFLDLSLHYAAEENYTILVMILVVPRLVLAAPVAMVDVLIQNWVIGLALILFLVMVARSRSDALTAVTGARAAAPPIPSGGGTLPHEKTPSQAQTSGVQKSGPGPAGVSTGSQPGKVQDPDTKIVAPAGEAFPKLPEKP